MVTSLARAAVRSGSRGYDLDMPNYVYAYATFEDGRRLETKFVGDQVGVRMFARAGAGAGVEQIGEWRGARVFERRVTNGRAVLFEIVLEGVDEPVPFSLDHWGGCHCSNPLKRMRVPAWEPAT